MSTIAADLTPLIEGDAALSEIAGLLDALDGGGRVQAIRALPGRLQARLWKKCEGGPPLALEDMLPAALPDGQTVIFAGKNSLPMFTWFEKRFARQAGAIVGYNHQKMSFVTGPGYFTVVAAAQRAGELLFDYTQVPASGPSGWPAAKPNSGGLSRLVYGGLHDYCRRVSRDVVIGEATRMDKPMDSYFLLARSS